MLRSAIAAAALLLLGACASSPQQNEPPNPEPRRGVGVLVNSSRGRCTTVVAGVRIHRVCFPRGRKPVPSDTIRTDTSVVSPQAGR